MFTLVHARIGKWWHALDLVFEDCRCHALGKGPVFGMPFLAHQADNG